MYGRGYYGQPYSHYAQYAMLGQDSNIPSPQEQKPSVVGFSTFRAASAVALGIIGAQIISGIVGGIVIASGHGDWLTPLAERGAKKVKR